MDRDLQERKLARYFADLDSDGNGVLEESDLAAAAGRTARAFGYADDAPAAQRLREACLGFWRELIAPMDADGDGRVTPAEMLAAFRRQLSGDPADSPRRSGRPRSCSSGWATPTRTAGSTGGVGEAVLGVRPRAPRGVPGRPSAASTARADGRVSREQFHQALTEFFYGGDPAAPGNVVFGRL